MTGSGVSAADADSAEAREVGAENANAFYHKDTKKKAFLPQSTGGFAQAQRKAEKVKKIFNAKALGRKDARDMQSGRFDTETPGRDATTIQTA